MVKQYLYIDASERHGKAPEADIREGLLEYFGAMSRAVDIPIMLTLGGGRWRRAPRHRWSSPTAATSSTSRKCTGIVTMQQTIGLVG